MELKDTINLIKEYFSLCRKFYEKRIVERFTCYGEENVYKLSLEVIDCIKNILKKRKHSYVSFDGTTFRIDIDGVLEDADLLDSTEWQRNVRDALNEYALEILSLRNAWNNKTKSPQSILDRHESKCQKLYDRISDWIRGNFSKETQETLMPLVKFWAIRGQMVNTINDVRLAEMSFEDLLENHPEWLE